jgi:uncharacterized protein YktB (UPF0637 family)
MSYFIKVIAFVTKSNKGRKKMKFVLGLIAIIIISLAVYVTMGLNGRQHVQKEVSKTVQAKEKAFEAVPDKVISKKVTHSKVDTPKHKVTSVKEVIPSVQNSTEIEDDELVTDEEYHPNANQTSDEPISHKEWSTIEKKMIESGQISQEGDSSASTENLGYDPSELAGEIQQTKQKE